jgi:hypothetical protein
MLHLFISYSAQAVPSRQSIHSGQDDPHGLASSQRTLLCDCEETMRSFIKFLPAYDLPLDPDWGAHS